MASEKISDRELENLNRKLLERFGSDEIGNAAYRVVWAPDQLERRKGHFDDYLEGTNIFLKTFIGIREVKKYSAIGEKYVLEIITPNVIGDELEVNKKLVYEYLMEFPEAKPPWYEAIEYFLRVLNPDERQEAAREYVEAMEKNEEVKYEKEIQYFEEILAEN